MPKEEIRHGLIDHLKKAKAFWSYDKDSIKEVSDELLVELVMYHLDLDDINRLFELYPAQFIKKTWIENVVPDERYYQMNRFFAWYYFGMKKPGQYVKSMATRQINRRLAV